MRPDVIGDLTGANHSGRRKRRWLLAGAFALVVGIASPATTPAGATSAEEPRATDSATSADCVKPGGGYELCTIDGGGVNKGIYERVTEIVNEDVAPGDSIQFAIYNWAAYDGKDGDRVEFTSLIDALTKRAKNGHTVRVLMGKGCSSSGSGGSCSGSGGSSTADEPTPQDKVKNRLENGGVEVEVCKKSCLPGPGGIRRIMHNKFLLIGDGNEGRVVQFTSNFMYNQLRVFQDLAVIPDDGTYRFYKDYFKRLWEGDWMGWGDRERTFPASDGADGLGTAYAFPRNNDVPVRDILQNVTCESGDSVRVAHGQIKDDEDDVVKQLRLLDRLGCDVRVAVDEDHSGEVSGLNSRVGPTHSKFILIDAHFNGEAQRRVYTGSHNPKEGARKRSNDMLVRVDPLFDAYSDYFESQWDQIG